MTVFRKKCKFGNEIYNYLVLESANLRVVTLFSYAVNILKETKWKGNQEISHNEGFTFYCIYHEFEGAGIFFFGRNY